MKTYCITLFIIINTICTQAQTVGLGASVNHLSMGINIEYGKNYTKNCDYQIGLKFIVNTFNYNENKQSHVYYLNGYAKHLYERFALNYRINRRLLRIKNLTLHVSANTLFSYHSLLAKNNIPDFFTGQSPYREFYRKPAPSLEITLCPRLTYNINNTITIAAQMGYGMVLLGYKHDGIDLVTGTPFYYVVFGKYNQNRGDIEPVGFERIPMMILGVNYKLNKRKK